MNSGRESGEVNESQFYFGSNILIATNRRDPSPYPRHFPPPLQPERQLLRKQQQEHPKPPEQPQQMQ